MILGLYKVEDGTVSIDDANIRQIRPEDIRRQFGVVTQSSFLFSGSIRENIAFGLDDPSEEEIILAARSEVVPQSLSISSQMDMTTKSQKAEKKSYLEGNAKR